MMPANQVRGMGGRSAVALSMLFLAIVTPAFAGSGNGWPNGASGRIRKRRP